MAKATATRSKAAAIMNEVNSVLGTPILKLGNDPRFEIVRIPTGSLTIDRITGGGFALGRHIEIFGDENSCKSFIAYRTMALSQARGKICALIDPEHAFDTVWFRHLGGIPEEVLTAWPETAEQAVDAMRLLFRKGEDGVEVVMVDSVAAMLPREDKERKTTDEPKIASQARLMSRALRSLTTELSPNTLVLWINQNRMKIGVFFGNPTTQTGGRALKFYDTTRIELRRGELIKTKGQKANSKQALVAAQKPIGNWVYAKSVKEKSTMPYGEGSFTFNTRRGEIDLASEIIQLGLEDGIIIRTGNTYHYEDIDGEDWSGNLSNFKTMIRNNEYLRDELIEYIADSTFNMSVPEVDNEEESVVELEEATV